MNDACPRCGMAVPGVHECRDGIQINNDPLQFAWQRMSSALIGIVRATEADDFPLVTARDEALREAQAAVEAAIPLQGRLQAYATALERVNVLISAVPPSFRIGSDHPAAVTIRAIDLCLRELSSQEERP